MNKLNNIYKDQLKSVFDDFEMDIPEGSWDRLEKSLDANKKALIIKRNWYIGSAVAAVAILIVGLVFISNPKRVDQTEQTLAESVAPTKHMETYTSKDESENILQTEELTTNEHIVAQNITQKTKETYKEANVAPKKTITDSEVEESIIHDIAPTQTTDNNTDKTELDNLGSKRPRPELSQEEIDKLIIEFQKANEVDIFDEDIDGSNTKRPLMLAFNAKGGFSASEKTANSPMLLRSANNSATDIKQSENTGTAIKNNLQTDNNSVILMNQRVADNNAEMRHSHPFSVGVTISKNIIDELSIETGLVYTYLHSISKNSSTEYVNYETQHLHYLGIPLNLNYNFINIGKAGIYASVGGMIEKDVYGKYVGQETLETNNSQGSYERNQSNTISLKNPQLSINAGIGLTYPIYGGFNIYTKIGGAYYFEANNFEYKTIYSDKKIIMDLNAGIRYNF